MLKKVLLFTPIALFIGFLFFEEEALSQSVLEINSPTTWTTDQEFTRNVEISAPLTIDGNITVTFQYADLTGDSRGDLYFSIENGGDIILTEGSTLTIEESGAAPPTPQHHWSGLRINRSNYTLDGNITVRNATYALTVNGTNVNVYNFTADETMSLWVNGTGAFFKFLTVSNVIAGDAALNINASNCTIDYLTLTTSATTGIDINSDVNPVLLSNSLIDGANIGIDNRGYLVASNVTIDNSTTDGISNTGIFGAENLTISNSGDDGIFIDGATSTTLIDFAIIENNASHGVNIGVDNPNVDISNSHLLSNDGVDAFYVNMASDDSNPVDFTSNWWGVTTNVSQFITELNPGSVVFIGWTTAVIPGVGATLPNSVTQTVNITNFFDEDVLIANQEYTLNWTTTGNIPYVDIIISGIAGDPLNFNDLPNVGSYDFTVPDGEWTGALNDGSIEVQNSANAAIDMIVTSLNTTTGAAINTDLAANFYNGLDTVIIRWNAPELWSQVRVQYNPNVTANPNGYTTQAILAASTGSYEWVIPNTSSGPTGGFPSAEARIRVVNNADLVTGAAESGSFTVSERPDIRDGFSWETTTTTTTMTINVNDVDFLADTNSNGVLADDENLISTANETVWVGAFFVNNSGELQSAGYAAVDNDGDATNGIQNDFSNDTRASTNDGGTESEDFSLTLYGDDITTPLVKEGPTDGDSLFFYTWRSSWDPSDNGPQVDANSRRINPYSADGTTFTGQVFAGGATNVVEQLVYTRPINDDNFRPNAEAQIVELPTSGGWSLISSYILPLDNTLGYDNTTASSAILSLPNSLDLTTVDAGFPVPDPDGGGPLTEANYQGVISSFVNTLSGNGTAGFDNDDDFVMLKDGTGAAYWNLNQAANTTVEVDQLTNTWNHLKGYMINTTALANATSIRFIGPRLVPQQTLIPITQGWNLIPYLRNNAIDVELGLSDIGDVVTVVKDEDGNIYWPRYAIKTIGNLQPGKAYWVFATRSSTFRYPSNSFSTKAPIAASSNQFLNNYSNASKTSNFMLLHLDFTDGWPQIDAEDTIIALDGSGNVVGSALVSENKSVSFQVNGKDEWSGDFGLEPNEEIDFVHIPKSSLVKNKLAIVQSDKQQAIKYQSFGIVETKVSELEGNNNQDELPLTLSLDQNYPNPFNPTTQIAFSIPEDSQVRLAVFDMQGRLVAELVNETLNAGSHSVAFNATNLASGIYLYRIQTKFGAINKRMTLLK
jgi:hypothetical protein